MTPQQIPPTDNFILRPPSSFGGDLKYYKFLKCKIPRVSPKINQDIKAHKPGIPWPDLAFLYSELDQSADGILRENY